MAHHRDAALVEETDRFRHLRAAFELDRGRARLLEQEGRAFEGLLGRLFVRPERHVDHDHRMIAAAHDRRGVGGHHVERDGDGGGQAVDHLRQRIPDQQHVAMRIEQLRLPRGVSGQHHQRLGGFPIGLVRADFRDRQPLHRLGSGVGPAGAGIELEGGGHGHPLASTGTMAKRSLDSRKIVCLRADM